MAAAATDVSFAGENVELVLSTIGDQAVRIELLPLGDNGQPISPPSSNVLVPFTSRELLRTRALNGETALVAGALRVSVSNHPLTVVARREDGSVVQRLVFEDAAGARKKGSMCYCCSRVARAGSAPPRSCAEFGFPTDR